MMMVTSQPLSSAASRVSSAVDASTTNSVIPISKNKTDKSSFNGYKIMHPHSMKRVGISNFVSKFQKKLGESWDSYQIAVSLFIVGKLSRDELMEQIQPVLENKETKHMHNQLLLSMLANCYKNEPLDGISSSIFGNSSKKRQIGNKSSQYEKLKKDILSLSIRERVRIKGISKESGKKGMIQNVMVLSRQALIPKIPIVTNYHHNVNTINGNANLNGSPKSSIKTSNSDSGSTDSKTGNTLEMTLISVKDILDMIDEPLSTETYELPERKRIRDIMLGLIREHGLLGGVSMKAVDVLYLGLIFHLKSIISNVIDNIRAIPDTQPNKDNNGELESGNNLSIDKSSSGSGSGIGKKRKRITITAEDLLDSFSLTPHMTQPYGTIDYLIDTKLKNDDDYDLVYRELMGPEINKTKTKNINKGKKQSSQNSSITSLHVNSTDTINNSNLWDEIETVINDTESNGLEKYVIPDKVSDISYILKSHKAIEEERVQNTNNPPRMNLAFKNKDLGTPDELAWVINDLLAEEI